LSSRAARRCHLVLRHRLVGIWGLARLLPFLAPLFLLLLILLLLLALLLLLLLVSCC
jgi:hypothetical protein